MLKIELIKSEYELKKFSNLFYNFVKVRLPISYLERGDVYLIYDGSEVVGGYMVLCNPPFRFIDLLPEYVKENNSFLITNQLERMYEVNGFFVKNKKFLLEIIKDLLKKLVRLDKSYLLLFFDSTNKKIAHTWKKNLEIIKIYEGAPGINCNKLKSHKNVFFGYVPQEEIESFYLNIIRRTQDYLLKLELLQRFKNE